MKILTIPSFVIKFYYLFLMYSVISYSQIEKDSLLYLGKVKSDSTSVSSHPILQSENDIEIWFSSSSSWDNPAASENGIFKLFFVNNQWEVTYRSYEQSKSLKKIELSSERIEVIFNELVANKIFYLEDLVYPQIESFYDKGKNQVISKKIHKGSDIAIYSIIYKLGSFYRHYEFEEPRTCYEIFPNIDDCKYAYNIVKIFQKNFYSYLE